MKLSSTKFSLWRPATLLLVWVLSLACSLLPGYTTEPNQPTDAATSISEQATETVAPTSQIGANASPTVTTATAGPYTLAISDRYPFFEKKVTIAQSLTAGAGQLWIGTIAGTIEEVDPQTGAFDKSISLVSESSGGSGGMPMAYPIHKMVFEGKYLWVYAGFFEGPVGASPRLFAIDPGTGEIVHQWDLNSPEWMRDYERGFTSEDFGVSPGKIWIDGHIVDTQTFEIQTVDMPGGTLFAYDEREWMWMNGEMGGACDDLILVNVNDPTKEWCEDDWPFFTHEASGIHPVGMGSPMVFVGDRVWMAGGSVGTKPVYILEAYPADIDQGMKATGPLVSVPFVDSYQSIKMLFAGDSLWVLDTLGDQKLGYLFQLDPRTGETINSLDLIGDEGRAIGDIPMDIATEGDNLWVLTSRQLLRIKLP